MEKGKFALYDENFSVIENFDIEQCKIEAKKGNPEAQTSLADCYAVGAFGVEKNEKKAYELALKASEQNIAEAYCLLGTFYSRGIYVEEDIEKCIFYYKESVKLGGCTTAFYNLALKYFTNEAYKDEKEAIKLLEIASERGHSPSMVLLAVGEEDETRAFYLLKKATELGNIDAQTELGLCYLKGVGTVKDEHRAFKLIQEIAVKYDYADALYWLGWFYATGTVVGKDEELAATYYEKAIKNGYQPDEESEHKTLEDYFNEKNEITEESNESINYLTHKNIIEKSVVYIESEKGSGSGFIFNSQGFAATCAHVVNDAKKLFVKVIDEDNKPQVYKASIVKINEKTDFAIIRIEDSKGLKSIELDIDRAEPHCGEEIVIYGYPLGDRLTDDVIDLNISFAKGYVSSNQIKDSIKKTMLDISAKHGNSGSPIISLENGKVLGILSGSVIGANIADEVNYMIPICYLKELLDDTESAPKDKIEESNNKNIEKSTISSKSEETPKEASEPTEEYKPLCREPLKTWPNVKRLLKKNLVVADEENDILAFNFDCENEDRTQRVFVEKFTSETSNVDWISISSCIGLIDNSEIDEVLTKLGTNCYGGLIKEDNKHYIRYSLLLETASEESLLNPIYAIALLADEIEEKYTGGDQY